VGAARKNEKEKRARDVGVVSAQHYK